MFRFKFLPLVLACFLVLVSTSSADAGDIRVHGAVSLAILNSTGNSWLLCGTDDARVNTSMGPCNSRRNPGMVRNSSYLPQSN